MIPKHADSLSYEQIGPPLSDADEEELLNSVVSWTIGRDGIHLLHRSFDFVSHTAALEFVKNVEIIVDKEQASLSSLHIHYQTVSLELNTQSVGGLSESDFIIASKIDNLYSFKHQISKENGPVSTTSTQ